MIIYEVPRISVLINAEGIFDFKTSIHIPKIHFVHYSDALKFAKNEFKGEFVEELKNTPLRYMGENASPESIIREVNVMDDYKEFTQIEKDKKLKYALSKLTDDELDIIEEHLKEGEGWF